MDVASVILVCLFRLYYFYIYSGITPPPVHFVLDAIQNLDVHCVSEKRTRLNPLKTCIKTLSYSIHSSKKHRQYESNNVNNRPTATKHSLCPGNGVFAHDKCIIFVILYIFVLTATKTRH